MKGPQMNGLSIYFSDTAKLADVRALIDSFAMRINLNELGPIHESPLWAVHGRLKSSTNAICAEPDTSIAPFKGADRITIELSHMLESGEQTYRRSPFFVESPLTFTVVLRLPGLDDYEAHLSKTNEVIPNWWNRGPLHRTWTIDMKPGQTYNHVTLFEHRFEQGGDWSGKG